MSYSATGPTPWNKASTWMPVGIPGPDDNITIAYVVTIPEGYQVNIGSKGVVTVSGGGGILNSGVLKNSGTILLSTGSIINEPPPQGIEVPGGSLVNSGTITAQSGDCTIGNSGTLTNESGGVITSIYQINNSPGAVIVNRGTINCTSISETGTNASQLSNSGTATNYGTINVNAGSSLTNSGGSEAGTLDNFGTLNFNGVSITYTCTGGLALNYSGAFRNAGSAVFNQEPGSTFALGSGSTFSVQADMPNPGGTVAFQVPQGTRLVIGLGCALTVNPTNQVSVSGTLDNYGTVELVAIPPGPGGFPGVGPAALYIQSQGVLNNNPPAARPPILGPITLGVPSMPGAAINNSNTIINYGNVYNNPGTRTLEPKQAFLVGAGTFNNAAKSVVQNSGTFTNNGTFNNSGTILNEGVFHTAGGVLNNSGQLQGNPLVE